MVSIEQNQRSPASSASDFGDDPSGSGDPSRQQQSLKIENSLNIYPLKEGKTLINGSGESSDLMLGIDDAVTEIDLDDANVRKCHCCLHKLDARVYAQAINGPIQVNNRVYEPGVAQVELCSGDFLVVGDFFLFQYQNPTDFAPVDLKPRGQINLVKLFKMLLLNTVDSDQSEREALLKVIKLLI